MMKKLIMLGLAVLGLLTSCSNDELVMVNDSNAIAFSTQVNKSTRGVAYDITSDNISSFNVYGYTALTEDADDWTILFNKEKVEGSGAGSDWSYSNVQYWKKDLNYKFHAIAPTWTDYRYDIEAHWTFDPISTTEGDNTPYSTGKITFENISSNSNGSWCNDEDLIYSYQTAKGLASNNPKVDLSFKHLLSRVKFRFVASGDATVNPANARYSVKEVRMSGPYKKGSIIVDYDKICSDVESPNTADKVRWDVSGDDNTAENLGIGYAEYQVNNASTFEKLEEKRLPQYKYTYDYLSNGTTKSTSETNYYFGPDGDYIEAETDHTYLIPAAVKYGDYSITFKASYLSTVNGYNGDGLSKDSPLEGTLVHVTGTANLPPVDMKKGYSYVYVIEVNAKKFEDIDPNYPDDTLKPIEFNVTDVLTYKTDDLGIEDDDEETNESYKLPEQTTIGEITDPTLVGTYDYAMSDGSFVSRYRTLTEEQKKACVGIVFWTAAESKYGLTIDDPILLKEKSSCTHGLIASLEELEYNNSTEMNWLNATEENCVSVFDTYQKYNDDLSKYGYVSIFGGTKDDGYMNAQRLLGYNNTQVLKKFNESLKDDTNKCLPVAALSNWTDIPKTSGWYIPSARELSILCSGEQIVSIESDRAVGFQPNAFYNNANREKLDKLTSEIKGTTVLRTSCYGSSTESYSEDWNGIMYYYWWLVSFSDGEVYGGGEGTAYEPEEFWPICAF